MHELGLALEIADVAAARSGGARVTRVVVEVGRLAAVLPDALVACFDLATAATPLEGAALEVVEVPGRGRCGGCGGEVRLDSPLDRCRCGTADLEWLSGTELTITALEVA